MSNGANSSGSATVAKKSNTSSKDATKKFVISTTKDTEVVRWNQEGLELLFSSDDFKQLSEAFIAQLSRQNRENYLEALAAKEGRKVQQDLVIVNPMTEIHMNQLKQLPERKGYHRVWVEGTQVTSYEAVGYKVVNRRPGEPFRIKERNPNGRESELIGMEIPQHLYERYRSAQALANKQKVDYTRDSFKSAVEKHNRLHGGKGKEIIARAGVTDPDDERAPIEE